MESDRSGRPGHPSSVMTPNKENMELGTVPNLLDGTKLGKILKTRVSPQCVQSFLLSSTPKCILHSVKRSKLSYKILEVDMSTSWPRGVTCTINATIRLKVRQLSSTRDHHRTLHAAFVKREREHKTFRIVVILQSTIEFHNANDQFSKLHASFGDSCSLYKWGLLMSSANSTCTSISELIKYV